MEITSIINNLKVRSIKDLDYRITKILEYISELALFEDDSETVTNIFSGMLVQRTKELVSGTLAFAIMKKLKIQEVREIVVSFVGQDEGNLKSSLLLKHTIKNTECHSKYYQNQNYYSDRNSRYENEKTKQLQQKISKYDRETRHHTNSSQQHSYNTRSYHNNNYNRNRHDVTNSSNEPLRQDSDSTRRQQYRQSEPMEVDVISQTPFETNTTEDIFFYQLASDRNKILLKLTIENQEYLALLDTARNTVSFAARGNDESDETEWLRLSYTSVESLKRFLSDDEMLLEEFSFCSDLAFPNELQQREKLDSLHEDAIEYVAGFIIRKLGLTEHISNEPTFTYVDEVSGGGLTKPSTSFLNTTKQLELVFQNFNGRTVRHCDSYLEKLIACSEHVNVSVGVKKLFFKIIA